MKCGQELPKHKQKCPKCELDKKKADESDKAVAGLKSAAEIAEIRAAGAEKIANTATIQIQELRAELDAKMKADEQESKMVLETVMGIFKSDGRMTANESIALFKDESKRKDDLLVQELKRKDELLAAEQKRKDELFTGILVDQQNSHADERRHMALLNTAKKMDTGAITALSNLLHGSGSSSGGSGSSSSSSCSSGGSGGGSSSNFCSECGKKHCDGKFCQECGKKY
jgi:hypothetical protein